MYIPPGHISISSIAFTALHSNNSASLKFQPESYSVITLNEKAKFNLQNFTHDYIHNYSLMQTPVQPTAYLILLLTVKC